MNELLGNSSNDDVNHDNDDRKLNVQKLKSLCLFHHPVVQALVDDGRLNGLALSGELEYRF